ncbi:hypothetical protein TeGR_g6112 [Tetraparma gracilis]|uniref:Progestin and adipoQ receptor family member 4 n=1 Tax=Tetraparma gracilis TaxID=2962635 RepID=A0ABQ6MEG7_9STRA|nr:hypothetical protein TeGR_g6112 [Tetraparma gracilis]
MCDPLMCSNLPLLPVALLFLPLRPLHGLLLLLTCWSSLLYHSTRERRHLSLDRLFAALSAASTVRLWRGASPPLLLFLALDSLLGFCCYARAGRAERGGGRRGEEYGRYHSAWHLAIAAGQGGMLLAAARA